MINVINMVAAYSRLCGEAKTIGAYAAYERYTQQYPALFEGILKYLYMTELGKLRSAIVHTDFDALLAIAKTNIDSGFIDWVKHAAERAASQLGFTRHFNLYLGMDLGNIGGYSGPAGNGAPLIFIGMDRPFIKAHIDTLIPHEINHMVRCAALPDIDMFDFMERTISEGLACICPIVLHKWEHTPAAYARVLGLPPESTARLLHHTHSLRKRLPREFGKPLTPALMAEHFTWSDRGDRQYLSGYYVGMVLIKEMLDKGYRFAELTVMPSDMIWRECSK